MFLVVFTWPETPRIGKAQPFALLSVVVCCWISAGARGKSFCSIYTRSFKVSPHKAHNPPVPPPYFCFVPSGSQKTQPPRFYNLQSCTHHGSRPKKWPASNQQSQWQSHTRCFFSPLWSRSSQLIWILKNVGTMEGRLETAYPHPTVNDWMCWANCNNYTVGFHRPPVWPAHKATQEAPWGWD